MSQMWERRILIRDVYHKPAEILPPHDPNIQRATDCLSLEFHNRSPQYASLLAPARKLESFALHHVDEEAV